MVRVLSIASLALAAVSAVSGLVVPRSTPPKGWQTDILEPYDTYHERYLALDCQAQHGKKFFDQCCHPLLANESLDALPPQCNPNDCDNDTTSTAAPSTTKVPPKPTSTPAQAPKPTHSPVPTQKPSTPAPEPTHTSTSTPNTPKPSPSRTPIVHAASSNANTGGQATWYEQNGVAGACGTVHSDSDLICAIDQDRYGPPGVRSQLCGKQVKITNTNNGQSVTVTIADDCPTCKNSNSIDLSKAAFQALGTLDTGILPIAWSFV